MRTRPTFGLIPAAVVATVLLITPACASQGRVYVRTAPPLPIVEVRAVAPRPGTVWIAGHHRWNGRAYTWVPGRWVAPPRARAIWVPGRWVHTRQGALRGRTLALNDCRFPLPMLGSSATAGFWP